MLIMYGQVHIDEVLHDQSMEQVLTAEWAKESSRRRSLQHTDTTAMSGEMKALDNGTICDGILGLGLEFYRRKPI